MLPRQVFFYSTLDDHRRRAEAVAGPGLLVDGGEVAEFFL
jgi:hypothetical protein